MAEEKKRLIEVVDWIEKMTGKAFQWHNFSLRVPCIEEERQPPVEVKVFLKTNFKNLTKSFNVRILRSYHKDSDGDDLETSLDFIEHMLWATNLAQLLQPCEQYVWTVEDYEQFEKEMSIRYKETS